MEIRFQIWHGLKSNLHSKQPSVFFNEREIWWCAVGKNIGVEVDGKKDIFARPVIIFKKLNQFSFLGIPLTTSNKISNWYLPFNQGGKENKAMMHQIRSFDCRRLYNKFGTLDDNDWQKLKSAFLKFIS